MVPGAREVVLVWFSKLPSWIRFAPVVGGVVVTAVNCTQLATDGILFVSVVIKSMYQPGGAKFGLSVTVTLRAVSVLDVIGKSTSRCSVSRLWVVAIGLIR
jgi:hypothetical protein